jgi:hypothetical protein
MELQSKIASGSFGTATTGSNGDIIDVITVTIHHFLKKQGMTPKKRPIAVQKSNKRRCKENDEPIVKKSGVFL